MVSPRASRPALLAVLLLTAGCLSGAAGDATTEGPTSTATAPPDHRAASNQPDPEKAVVLENEWDRSVEMHVRVVRDATNRTVHEANYTVGADEERTVYSVAAADPDGIESFTVVVTTRDTTDRVTIETSACYGNVYAEIQADGTPYVYYAIC